MAAADLSRTRTFTWQDPEASARAGLKLSGLEYLQAMMRGEIAGPPIAQTLGFANFPIEVEPGKVSFFLEPAEFHYNPIGTVHGGVIATLLDSAVGCAVHSRLEAGVGYTSVEIKVNFIKAVTSTTGLLRCEGVLISLGRRIAVAEARLTDAAGKLYAHCTSTLLIIPPEPR